MITCTAKLVSIHGKSILHLPASASAKLPSRAMNMVAGTMNGKKVQLPLEPDGKKGHWCKVNGNAGDMVTLELRPMDDWPEPKIPADLKKALTAHPKAFAVWKSTTPIARWDWVRWTQATNNPATRKKHVDVAISKLTSGMKRPCCFNRAMCTDFSVCKSGVLPVS